jgi:hypothetical protein
MADQDFSWEPIESFEESGQIVDDFWSRTNDVRDIRDLKKFRVGERFLPLGPRMSSSIRGSNTHLVARSEKA